MLTLFEVEGLVTKQVVSTVWAEDLKNAAQLFRKGQKVEDFEGPTIDREVINVRDTGERDDD